MLARDITRALASDLPSKQLVLAEVLRRNFKLVLKSYHGYIVNSCAPTKVADDTTHALH
jgi:hypothetical protein